MGTDWHPYFETQQDDGTWIPTWYPVPDKDYWWEDILDQQVRSYILSTTGEDQYEYLSNIYENMPMEEVIKKFSNHPQIIMHWPYPMINDRWSRAEIQRRDYGWFKAVGLYDDGYFNAQYSLPNDCCKEITREYNLSVDRHTVTWIMVDEILSFKELRRFEHYHWLKKMVPKPEKTRLIFWYDN